ncbi:MAG: type II toxin-antitoxin system MqsA family antitoxin [Hahellaceae bacterium]|nr:type II toxin-antitoxin system MqsA family antitoxin [Hahellaceae bacterium]MCP5168141.1 type II toxin-antitoxin system MqsA family antitoxin [Hahellaceae bacterium]
MKCLSCKQGEAHPGHATVTLERDGSTLVFKSVPADICDNCGEEYIQEIVTDRMLAQAEECVSRGVQVDVRQYQVA